MIKNRDRSGWIGASDTAMVMGKWSGKTFEKWWSVKLGVRTDHFTTPAMQAGTHYEHRILEHIGVKKMDRQIKIRRLRLRVNLDGETADTVKEVKTYGGEQFRISKAYWMQAQVQMYVTRKKLDIVAYRLTDGDYDNYFNRIDPDRLSEYPIEYDAEWLRVEWMPRQKYLARCLKKGVWPNESWQAGS